MQFFLYIGDGKVYLLHTEEKTQLFKPLPFFKAAIKNVSCGKEHVLLLSKIGIVFSFGSGR
jgi:alpha-tubulin suppressor-like RCC1 family protein